MFFGGERSWKQMGVAFGAVVGQFCSMSHFKKSIYVPCNCWYVSTTHVYTRGCLVTSLDLDGFGYAFREYICWVVVRCHFTAVLNLFLGNANCSPFARAWWDHIPGGCCFVHPSGSMLVGTTLPQSQCSLFCFRVCSVFFLPCCSCQFCSIR